MSRTSIATAALLQRVTADRAVTVDVVEIVAGAVDVRAVADVVADAVDVGEVVGVMAVVAMAGTVATAAAGTEVTKP